MKFFGAPKIVVTHRQRSYGAAAKETVNGIKSVIGKKLGKELTPAVSMTREGDTDDFAAH